MYINDKHKNIVKNRKYIYVGSYKWNEIVIDKKIKNKNTYIRVKCPYCGKEYDIKLQHFKNGTNCKYCCNLYENSFAYYIQFELGEGLNKYWDWEKNTVNPYLIYKSSNKYKIWIKCTETNYHGSYFMLPNAFHSGNRCPYCNSFASHKVHPKDSFGALYPEKAKYWSENNNKTPYEVAPHSRQIYKFICEKCGEEFQCSLDNLIRGNRSMKCLNCTSSKGEQKINNWLSENNIKFEIQKEFNGLLGINNGNLKYDFYLPNNNLLIEYQGEFHDGTDKMQSKERFLRQQEHDRRKREYAKNHNIELLEIWYWDFDNIENILSRYV